MDMRVKALSDSSARLERFLQLCAEDNMQVFNLTTPAQYYHMLRKQCLQEHKKPGILMSPKVFYAIQELSPM